MKKVPIIAILVFAALYFYASVLYPGGSQANTNQMGFDWCNNYWCNLLNKTAINGEPNPARPWAIFASVVLCVGVIVFFNRFANLVLKNSSLALVLKIFGTISMVLACFVFTKYHDQLTVLSSIAGFLALVAIIKGVYKSHWPFYKYTGLVCILLIALNNYIYYSEQCIFFLPMLQKITFGIVLLWMAGLSWQMERQV